MKILIIALTLISSISSYAFTNCNTAEKTSQDLPTFSINIHHTDKIQALVTDRRVSMIPRSYICEVETTTQDGNKLTAYACVGGGYNEEKIIVLLVNETALLANYLDTEDENSYLENLNCEIE